MKFIVKVALLFLIVNTSYGQFRDSSTFTVPTPSGKKVKITQFYLGTDTTARKVAGGLTYRGGFLYYTDGSTWIKVANTTTGGSVGNADSLGNLPASSYQLKADSTIVSAGYGASVTQSNHTATVSVDSSVIMTRGSTQVITAPKYFTARQYMTSLNVDTLQSRTANNSMFINDSVVIDNGLSVGRGNSVVSPNGGNFTVGKNNTVSSFDGTSVVFGERSSTADSYSLVSGLRNRASSNFALIAGASDTANGSYNFLFGDTLYTTARSVFLGGTKLKAVGQYSFFFGTNIHLARQTTFGFGGGNTLDTIRFGHATVSHNVPFVASSSEPKSGGAFLNGYGWMNDQSSDTSSFIMGQYLGAGGVGGTSTTSFAFAKTKGTRASNFDKWDGTRVINLFIADTSNNIIFNQFKTSDFNYGDVTVANNNFLVSAGSVDSDSIRDDGTTRATSGTWHSGIGAWSLGAISTGAINTNGSSITSGSVSATSGTFRDAITQNENSTGNLVINNSTGTPLAINVYSTSATTGSALQLNRGRGTSNSSYSALNSGDVIFGLLGSGAVSSAAFSGNTAGIRAVTNEAWSSTANGTYIDMATTQAGATTRAVGFVLDQVNSTPRLTIGATAGTGTGNVYLDSIYAGTTLFMDANRNTTTRKETADSLSVLGKVTFSGISSDSTTVPSGGIYFRASDGILRRKY